MEVCNLLDDSPSLCCASGNSFLEMDVADLLSPYGPEKEMDSIGTFSSVPIACSFNSVALPCEFSCKEVLTPPQLSLAPCNSSSSSSSTQESSLSDEEVQMSPRLRRSIKHSISEKRRVIRFNTCIDEFISMLSANGISVRKNKLQVLEETVRTMRMIQNQISEMKRKLESKKASKVAIPRILPTPDQQEYYHFFHNLTVPCIVVSLAGLILDVNRSFCDAVSKEKSSLLSRSIFSVMPSSSLPLLYTSFSSLLARNPPVNEREAIQLFWNQGQLQPHSISVSLHISDATVFVLSFTPLIHCQEPCEVHSFDMNDLASLSFQLSSGETYCVVHPNHAVESCSQTCAVSSEMTPIKLNLESPKNSFF